MRNGLLILLLTMLLISAPAHASNVSPASRDYATANKLLSTKHFQDALTLYQKLLTTPPQNVPLNDIYSRIGDSYFGLESYKNALDAYRTALKGQKESDQPATRYWIGFCCFLLGRDEEAVTEFLRIPERHPGSKMWVGTAYYWAGRASARMGKTEAAAEYYHKAAGNGRSTQGKFALKKADSVKGRKE